MKSVLLFITVILFSTQTFGQEAVAITNDQFSLNLVAPSIEWEVSTGQKSTIDLKLGTGIGYAKSGSESEFGFFPHFASQYRYYYNFDKRIKKGKKVSENSGNYLAAIANIRSGNSIIGDLDLREDYAILIGPAWGLQRTYNSGFKLNLNLGAGYGFNDIGDSYFSPFIGIQLGWLVAK
ncbi:DUF3575 domain-containing protein [Salegentibacter sp. LM13S]|uniref:DUF3575 domain-containing protein n=1 Tax=Salegentibacter lacus TaxID=2873599 RepID=UPI001CC9FC6E|nr:DUF3575 domain-containing protein [Salegentibacter lacus]MBZ9629712.1 DUF3575 domain-containing protein [Salegentibacter lacus]